MPTFVCPNCHRRVRVAEHQMGRVLRCSKCGGRFVADVGLPPDVAVEDYDGQEPPVQVEQQPQRPAWQPSTSKTVFVDSPQSDDAPGWWLFVLLTAAEVLIGFLVGMLANRILFTISIVLGFVFYYPIGDLSYSDQLTILAVRWLLLAHEVLLIVALFWVAAHARRHGGSGASWILPIIFLQGVGVGIYMVGRPRGN